MIRIRPAIVVRVGAKPLQAKVGFFSSDTGVLLPIAAAATGGIFGGVLWGLKGILIGGAAGGVLGALTAASPPKANS